MILISWSKKRSFLTQEIGRKMIFPKYFWKIAIFEEPRKINFQALKNSKMIFLFCKEFHVNWFLKSSCKRIFGDWKYGLYWDKKLKERWYSMITEKSLILVFLEMRNTVFFEQKFSWKYGIYRLPKSYCFELSGDEKYGLLSKKSWWKDGI